MKAHPTLIAVVDGAHARFLLLETPGGALRQNALPSLDSPAPPSRDLVSDGPGRVFDSTGRGRHATQPTSDPHNEAERAFARRVAEILDKAVAREGWRLFLIADPRTLGHLRGFLGAAAAKALVGDLAKDHVKSDLKTLRSALAKSLPIG